MKVVVFKLAHNFYNFIVLTFTLKTIELKFFGRYVFLEKLCGSS